MTGVPTVQTKRPVNLDLSTMRFPVAAIISILHRVTGVWLFIALPFLLYWLGQSLLSAQRFQIIQACIHSHLWVRFLMWTVLAAATYHLVAGIRHIIMDLSIGDTVRGGRITAWCVLIISIILAVIEGVWLW
jgi:succinate dehydrogenase / fumarate reductase cytochrome b subunit